MSEKKGRVGRRGGRDGKKEREREREREDDREKETAVGSPWGDEFHLLIKSLDVQMRFVSIHFR